MGVGAIGLIIMTYPPLAQVCYEKLGEVSATSASWSIAYHWIIGLGLMFWRG
jgi:ACR3 family arsenite efflux pump ArsB